MKAQAFVFTAANLIYGETFDVTDPATPARFVPGWTSTDTTIALTDGSANGGGIYDIATSGTTDRAFGSLASGSLQPIFGASFLNSTGSNIGQISFAGFMEQWRTGTAAAIERLPFQYSFNATSLTDGTWSNLASFDLVEKADSVSPNGAINGNAEANRTAISSTAAVVWGNGVTMWIRWNDIDNGGSDGMYAIDDFSLGVTIVAIKSLVWNPPPATWNLTNMNWLDGAAASVFTTGDTVNFTQSGIDAGGGTVTIDVGGLAPAAINVSNATGTYTFTGGGLSGTGTLTKTNAGTAVLATTYTNSVVVNGGILRLGAADLLGDSASISVGTGGIFESNNFDETVSSLVLSGGTVNTGTGTLTLGTTINSAASATTGVINGLLRFGDGPHSITAGNGAAAIDLQINAAISSTSAGTFRTALNGPGVIALNADNNSFGAGFSIPGGAVAGNVLIGHPNALGSNVLFFNGGTLSASVPLIGANAATTFVSLGGNVTLGAGAAVEWSGEWSFAFDGAQSRIVTVNNANTFTGGFNGSDDTVIFNGTGSARIAAAASFLARVNIEGAAVVIAGAISGDMPTNVALRSGTLRGGGSVTGNVAVGDNVGTADALFGPGDGDIGTFTLAGLSFNSDATFEIQLRTNAATPTADRVIASTSVALGAGVATLAVTDLASTSLVNGTAFTIIENQSLDATTGFFLGLGEGTRFMVAANEFTISYSAGVNANDVMLVVIPEPTTLGLLACGTALLGWRRRRG